MSFAFGEVQTFVSELNLVLDFYQTKLGLKLIQLSQHWAIFDVAGVSFVLMAGAEPRETSAYGKICGTVLCLTSSAIEEDIDRLKAQGVRIIKDVQTVPQGKYAVISDPDGNFIEIIQHVS